jgi:hypothetical protein
MMVWQTHEWIALGPDCQFTRQHEILLHKYWMGTQALLIHADAHAGLSD